MYPNKKPQKTVPFPMNIIIPKLFPNLFIMNMVRVILLNIFIWDKMKFMPSWVYELKGSTCHCISHAIITGTIHSFMSKLSLNIYICNKVKIPELKSSTCQCISLLLAFYPPFSGFSDFNGFIMISAIPCDTT